MPLMRWESLGTDMQELGKFSCPCCGTAFEFKADSNTYSITATFAVGLKETIVIRPHILPAGANAKAQGDTQG